MTIILEEVKRQFPLKDIIGGMLCDQMIKDIQSVSTDPKYNAIARTNTTKLLDNDIIRERQESFICLSVDVKGSSGLLNSLERYVLNMSELVY